MTNFYAAPAMGWLFYTPSERLLHSIKGRPWQRVLTGRSGSKTADGLTMVTGQETSVMNAVSRTPRRPILSVDSTGRSHHCCGEIQISPLDDATLQPASTIWSETVSSSPTVATTHAHLKSAPPSPHH